MYLLKILGQISDFCLQIFGKVHKNRVKKLQFNGVKQSKIRWMDLEIKFVKGESFFKIWQPKNYKVGLKKSRKNHNIRKYMLNVCKPNLMGIASLVSEIFPTS